MESAISRYDFALQPQGLIRRQSGKASRGGAVGFCLKRHVGVCMEKAMATHSSTLAWKIPWTEEPGRLQSLGSLGVGHD